MKKHRIRNWWFGILLGLSLAAGPAQAVDVGQKAPEFALPSSTGKEIKLADFAGKKNVVLFFYIGAFTNT
jgi:peroxiredoxin Q/BCP